MKIKWWTSPLLPQICSSVWFSVILWKRLRSRRLPASEGFKVTEKIQPSTMSHPSTKEHSHISVFLHSEYCSKCGIIFWYHQETMIETGGRLVSQCDRVLFQVSSRTSCKHFRFTENHQAGVWPSRSFSSCTLSLNLPQETRWTWTTPANSRPPKSSKQAKKKKPLQRKEKQFNNLALLKGSITLH